MLKFPSGQGLVYVLYESSDLKLVRTLWDSHFHYPHFIDNDPEAETG